MIDYVLQIELESGTIRCYQDIVSIEVYDKSLRMKDIYGFITYVNPRKIKHIKILPIEKRGDNNED